MLTNLEEGRPPLLWSQDAQAFRPRGVIFCSESGVLIRDLDHFCPWTGTTIGGGNIKFFYWFLLSIALQMFAVFSSMFASI